MNRIISIWIATSIAAAVTLGCTKMAKKGPDTTFLFEYKYPAASIRGTLYVGRILTVVKPEYPEWALKRGMTDVWISIRIEVMPDGSVSKTTVDQSSGFPEWDTVVMEALSKCRFAPLPADVKQEVQWGIIPVHFFIQQK